jgi:hypothetical protein
LNIALSFPAVSTVAPAVILPVLPREQAVCHQTTD